MPNADGHKKSGWSSVINWLKIAGVAIVSASTVFGFGYKLLEPHIDEKIDDRFYVNVDSHKYQALEQERIDRFLHSADFKMFVSEMQMEYEKKHVYRNSDSVKFRTLCSYTMLVDENSVHLEIGRMYRDWKDKQGVNE